MTQTAKVKKILSTSVAEVAVKRVSACAHDCSKCASGGCKMLDHPDLTVKAYNAPGAQEGDVVLVESSSKRILSMAAVVYLLPFVLMLAGYLVGSQLGLGENGSVLLGGVLFCLSFLVSIGLNKRVQKNAVQFSITQILS